MRAGAHVLPPPMLADPGMALDPARRSRHAPDGYIPSSAAAGTRMNRSHLDGSGYITPAPSRPVMACHTQAQLDMTSNVVTLDQLA